MKLPKTYDPSAYEPTIYGLWESSGAFRPTGKGEPYSIVMPPPNANGNLHLGHGLMIALQDILIRYHRMQGKDTVYIPGADHAGFETWVVYEKELAKQGKSRFDFSREQLYSQVWDFVEARRGDMELQSRALGASASWDDLVFTLDEKVITTVYSTFKRLWDDKLIYRGKRIVNYCTFHQTSFADIEVAHRDEKSNLWEIAYPLSDGSGEVIVATTRPETMLGDTAVAVDPTDVRYKDLIGKTVRLPLVNRDVPIVADDHVDAAFGTGAVKVTPAHDPNDYEIGQRHDLPSIEVIGTDGKILETMPEHYAGLPISEARAKVVADLEAAGALKGVKELIHSVGHCYKCGTIIEPLLSEQWFLSVKSLAKRAIKAIKSGDINVTPASKAKVMIQYLEGLNDWNLSRQIAWGIPVPAFQNVEDETDWIFDTRVEQPTITVDGRTYRRDEDTFDTWFSSSQWPFVVTDYLQDGDLKRFYPSSVMETGHDILFWVTRMIMLGLYATDKIPFTDVYVHGLVLDERGQKMSKSKGNVINPMDILDAHGSDAFRMGIVASRSAGQNQAFARDKVIAARNFANKLWNVARFIEAQLPDDVSTTPEPTTIADHWILERLDTARRQLESQLAEYRFAEAGETIYHTIWGEVADWYLEASKAAPNPSVLAAVLDTSLRLAHPFAPFVTEAIWNTLKWNEALLISSPWPEKLTYNEIAAGEFEQLKTLVTEARFVARELPGGKQTLLYEHDSLIADNTDLVKRLAGLADVKHIVQPKGLRLAVPNREAWLEVDADTLYEHQTKLETRLAETREHVHKLQLRLTNENYVKHAPENVVTETRDQLKEQLELEARLQRELQVINQ